MLSGDPSYEFMSGIEDSFGPRVYGGHVARLRPARHLAPAEEPDAAPKDPFTEDETKRILADCEDLG